MPDYISREAALAKQKLYNTYDSAEMAVPVDALREIPAADVVEVVRCCDCAYHEDRNYHYCRKWRRDCPDDSDFFCKWGKRKDGGQDE